MRQQVIAGLLEALPFFGSLVPSRRHALAALMTIQYYDSGAVIFREGDPASGVFFIASGQVRIGKGEGEGQVRFERFLATLEAGDVFGELSLLLDEPRTAGALVTRPAELFKLDRAKFLGLLEARDELSWHLYQVLLQQASERLRDAVQTGSRAQTGPADTAAMVAGLSRITWR